jgi:hypothetical protein
MEVINMMDWFISFIKQLNVNLAYLTTVTALSGTIVAIAIPLSIDIIARISARFESSIIAKKFNSEKSIVFLKIISFLLLFSSSAILFLYDENLNSFNWNLIIFIHFIISIISIVFLLIFFKKIVSYIKDNRYILNKLFNNANKAINYKGNYDEQKDIFIESVEGIGDVLVHITQYKKNKLIKNNLRKFSDLIINYTDLVQIDQSVFEKITFEKWYLEKYYSQDEENRNSLNFISPHRRMISFRTTINQFLRIYNASSNKENEDIIVFVINNLSDILLKLVTKENTGLLTKNILIKFNDILRKNINKDYESTYFLATKWYTKSIYSVTIEESVFNFDYLELFNKYLKANLRIIIKNEKFKLFNSFISDLDLIHLNRYRKTIASYSNILLLNDKQIYVDKNIQMLTKKLDKKLNKLYNNESLDEWIKEFDKLKNIIEKNLPDEKLNDLWEEEKKVINFVLDKYKYNNLLQITCYIGAYCIFKKKYNYIKYMWNYHQPQDASHINAGHDFIPNSFTEILDLIVRGNLFYNNFWEGNHGSKHYYEIYLILLFMKTIQKNEDTKISLSNYNARELNNLNLNSASKNT